MNQDVLLLLKELDLYAKEHHNKCWCIPFDEAQFLHLLITLTKPKFILEIGTSIGFSTIWLASAAEEYEGTVKTIEINEERTEQAQINFKKANLKNITLLKGDANIILKDIKAPFDFILLDAGKEHYLEQLHILEKNSCIKKDTIICADNAAIKENKKNEKLQQYLEYVRNSKSYNSSYIPFENGLEVSVKI
ncbi:MAG: class I SAM-dependent methyltransferase [Nanoarchaeota archaeon]